MSRLWDNHGAYRVMLHMSRLWHEWWVRIMSDVEETVTRKIGPLPVWGWGVAVGGAFLVYRMVRGGGTPVALPSSGPATDTSGSPTAGDSSGDTSTFGAGVPGPAGPAGPKGTTGAPGAAGAAGHIPTSYTNLLIQLQTATHNQLVAVQGLADAKTQINKILDDYRSHRISKATYTSRTATQNARVKTYTARIAQMNTVIASLQTQLGKVAA